MQQYHKIRTLWKRESEKPCDMIIGTYATPEFEYLKNCVWTCTEKIDGTNVRVIWDKERVSFGGKTDNAQMPIFLLDRLQALFNSEIMRQVFGNDSACLYGEGYGAKIQKGGGNYHSDSVDFILFDIKIGTWWLQRDAIENISKKLGVDKVPVVYRGRLPEISDFVSIGFDSLWGNFRAEGIVAKPEVELIARNGNRIITKLKCKDFK